MDVAKAVRPAYSRCRPPSYGSRALRRQVSVNCKQNVNEISPLYDLLGVETSAATSDIRRAYRDVAARLHPDISGSQHQAQFKAVNLAYEVLSDPELRRQYDQHGLKALGAGFSYLREYFGVSGERAVQPRRGEDVFTVMGLQLQEAVTGVTKAVQVNAMASCADCQGTGLPGGPAGGAAEQCEVCRGMGEIMRSRWMPQGRLQLVAPCPACRGKGTASRASCTSCGGEGRARVKRRVEVRVPAGVEQGSVLKVSGQGDCGVGGGAAGDLYIKVKVYQDESIRREGVHLFSEVQVGVLDAVLGVSLGVKTYRGERLLDIPPGTQHGEQLVVKGAGVPAAQGGVVQYGDHFFQVQLVVPSRSVLSSAQLQLLDELRALQPAH